MYSYINVHDPFIETLKKKQAHKACSLGFVKLWNLADNNSILYLCYLYTVLTDVDHRVVSRVLKTSISM